MSRLGELLVRENLISLAQLQKAQEEQRKTGARLGYSLTKLGIIDEEELTTFLSKQYGVPSINLAEFEISPDVLQLVPPELAKRHQLIPVNRAGATLIVAMSDPSNIYAIDDLKFRTGLNIEVVVASRGRHRRGDHALLREAGHLRRRARRHRRRRDRGRRRRATSVNVVDLEKASGEAPVIKLCNVILLNAIKKRARDIHIEPYEKSVPRPLPHRRRALRRAAALPLKLKNAVTSRIKIMSQLDISERRLPQDGRIKLKLGKDKEMDFRVSRPADAVRREDRPPTRSTRRTCSST